MFIQKKLHDETQVLIIVRPGTVERLSGTCFRGINNALAGNFLRWGTVEEVFSDKLVVAQFLDLLNELWLKQAVGTHSVNIQHSLPVGWESTAPLEGYDVNDLEPFSLNRRSMGLRVKLSQTNFLAPQTDCLTLIFELKLEEGKPVAVIHSMYPGFDIGELLGDVTEREQRIFFDWNHPGQV